MIAARMLRVCGALPLLPALLCHAAAAAAPVSVEVDARQAARGILASHLTLPVTPGPLTLVYPRWLPGRHAPDGPITSLAGPRLTAGGQKLAWRRDAVDSYAFHLVIPAGISTLEVELEVLTAPAPDGIVQGLEAPRTATESLLILEWNQALLYPAGRPTDQLSYQAAIRLPEGWRYATALTAAAATADGARFAPTSLTTLVDSPLLAGRFMRTVELGGTPAVRLQIAADRPAALEARAEVLEHYRNLAREGPALFGATHYRQYQFLWALTDQVMEDGLEHHESSDNRSPLRTLLDDDLRRAEANLLAHEYSHSWNGKFRRPAGLATPDYQVPMRTDLLWVYEGLTEYLGDVLAARSGLLTEAEFRDELARIAAQLQVHRGREWRSLQDATDAAPLLYYQDHNWAARLRRQDDFYWEPALLWLEADAIIRSRSHGQRSLDDFCRRFYGAPSTAPEVRSYEFADLIAALEAVEPYDWRAFWRERLDSHAAPLTGLQAAGWHLGFSAQPSSMHVAHEVEDNLLNLQYSLGLVVSLDGGTLLDVVPGSPADEAGVAPASKLVAVNGHKWSREVLHDALGFEARQNPVLGLLVEKDDEYRTLAARYAGGERYPVLEREAGTEDLLAAIARPLAPAHAPLPAAAQPAHGD